MSYRGYGSLVLFLSAGAAALIACDEPTEPPSSYPSPPQGADDPGCTVLLDDRLAGDAGRSLSVVHRATLAADAGDLDAGDLDAGAHDADAPDGDAGEPDAPVDPADAGAPDASAPIVVEVDRVRTVACRAGTTFDVAAAPAGDLRVVAAGSRGHLIEFQDQTRAAVPVAGLHPSAAKARIATLPDGRPFVVGLGEVTGQLLVTHGEGAPTPVVSQGDLGLGALVQNQRGHLLVPMGANEALLRTSDGLTVIGIAASPFANQGTRLGLGNDDVPFRVTLGSSATVERGEQRTALGGGATVQGVAFTTLSAEVMLPAVALVRTERDGDDSVYRSFDVALPVGRSEYVRVPIFAAGSPCAVEPGCSNECSEAGVDVDPGEVAMAWDGSHAYVVFVRRSVQRTRRYRYDQNTGFECRVFDCDPYCTSSVSQITESADLVVAVVDVERRSVEERYELPLETSAGAVRSSRLNGDQPRVQASARDGYLHVSRFGEYQNAFEATSTYRFRLGP